MRILEGDGTATRAQRRAAFDNARLTEPLHRLVSKVAEQPTQVTDQDFTAAKASGLSEDQVFELVICAAVGQATRQYQSALVALDMAMTDRKS
jgi:hypothetical protein